MILDASFSVPSDQTASPRLEVIEDMIPWWIDDFSEVSFQEAKHTPFLSVSIGPSSAVSLSKDRIYQRTACIELAEDWRWQVRVHPRIDMAHGHHHSDLLAPSQANWRTTHWQGYESGTLLIDDNTTMTAWMNWIMEKPQLRMTMATY